MAEVIDDDEDFVTCPQCGNEQADMGHLVACEECDFAPMPTNTALEEPPRVDDLQKLVEKIATKLFCSGQMDAQGSAAEKRKIGAGGPVLALSRRLYAEATDELAALLAQRAQPPDSDLTALVERIRTLLVECDSELSAYAHHRPLDKAVAKALSERCRDTTDELAALLAQREAQPAPSPQNRGGRP